MSKPAYYLLVAGALLGLAAVTALQLVAVCGIVNRVDQGDPFFAVVAIAFGGGAVQALLCHALLPAAYREPRGWALLWLWLACSFVPLLGGMVVLASCVWAAWFPGEDHKDRYGDIAAPQFVSYLISRVSHGGGARLQARLVNTQVAAQDRLSALVAIQSMPTRTTGPLLRDLLADPIEDVRLIAYGALDRAENEIMQRIFRTSEALEQTRADAREERHTLHRQLAELYFELVYQNLVQGAVYRHTLEQADRHATIALENDDNDAALWLIRGRVALANNQAEAAGRYIGKAEARGFPRERLVPWLAEAAFLRGEYSRVSELLGSLGNTAALPVLKPLVRYWST
ncbi:hypothetical protein LJR230_004068 [Trinickia sp. LjRoot230]|uniref:hypothetical protein n=1 Tax=Trinickia sp. LjRoot230 TaxID=3342288 RepID=UPI003ECC57E0